MSDTIDTGSTLATMQARLLDEVGGALTVPQITNAINDAIKKYQRESWWFTQARFTILPITDQFGNQITDQAGNIISGVPFLQLVPGQEWYGVQDYYQIPLMPRIYKISVLYGSTIWRLTPRSNDWIEDNNVSQTFESSFPTDWAYFQEQIRFYPIPSAFSTAILQGIERVPALSDPTQTNVWMAEGEELIRCCAASILCRRLLRDSERAGEWAQDEAQAYAAMVMERESRSTGAIRPWCM